MLWNTNAVLLLAWMLWLYCMLLEHKRSSALGMDALGCRISMLLEHERYYALGMDALVIESTGT